MTKKEKNLKKGVAVANTLLFSMMSLSNAAHAFSPISLNSVDSVNKYNTTAIEQCASSVLAVDANKAFVVEGDGAILAEGTTPDAGSTTTPPGDGTTPTSDSSSKSCAKTGNGCFSEFVNNGFKF